MLLVIVSVVRGDRFLYHMVRAMVGAAFTCVSGKWYTQSDIAAMCATDKNAPTPYIAEAEGLALRLRPRICDLFSCQYLAAS